MKKAASLFIVLLTTATAYDQDITGQRNGLMSVSAIEMQSNKSCFFRTADGFEAVVSA